MRQRVYDLSESAWRKLRPDVARGVAGASLLPEGFGGGIRIVLTRVEPGGEFATHVDPYHHVFYFMEGEGEGWAGEEHYSIRPQRVAEIPAGVPHGYRNTGGSDLVLLTVNLPIKG